MDRQIVYPGSLPRSQDFLTFEQSAGIAIGYLAQATFGTPTWADGLGCTPTAPASLTVQVAPGSLATLTVLEATPFGGLPADSVDPLVKVGVNTTATTFTITPPTSAGQSQAYLIAGAFSESDTSPILLPYYNSSNPQQSFQGPNGSGVSQNTQRIQRVALQLVPGAPAPSGSQATPAAPEGYVGLWVVTVAEGQTEITAGNIVAAQGAPFVPYKLPQLAPAGSYTGGNGITIAGGVVAVRPGSGLGFDGSGNLQADLAGGTGISVSGATISTALTGGNGVSVSGASIAAKAGTGIAFDGSGNLEVALAAGTGIAVAGATISTALTGGTGISVSGATISTALTGGNGVSVSGASIAAKAGTGIAFDGSGNLEVALAAGTGIAVAGATISTALTGGSGVSVSGASIAAKAGTGIAFDGSGNLEVNLAAGAGIAVAGATISTALTGANGVSVSGATIGAKLGAGLGLDGSGNIQIAAQASSKYQTSSAGPEYTITVNDGWQTPQSDIQTVSFTFPSESPTGSFRLFVETVVTYFCTTASATVNFAQANLSVYDNTNSTETILVGGGLLVNGSDGGSLIVARSGFSPVAYAPGTTISLTQRAKMDNTGSFAIPSASISGQLALTAVPAG